MTGGTERWERLEALFHRALELEPEDRAPLLQELAAEDAELAADLADLLASDVDDEAFLSADHAAALAGSVLDEAERERAADGAARLGPWELCGVLGEGGMGVVHDARRVDGEYEARVAIKRLHAGPSTRGLLARFEAERRTLARLEHPGIARLVDAGRDAQGAPWLAMEYVAGEPIDRWCDARRADLRARVRLVRAVCDAVAHAHDQLVVHRDIKPQNVLVDDEGRPRLLDFGIAKVLENDETAAALTLTGERVLTPAFAAPEQVAGEPVGPRTDVYALGALLYVLLSGARPFDGFGESRAALERAVLGEDPPPPSRRVDAAVAAARGTTAGALSRALAGDLDRICAFAMRKEPARRYASVRALADDLDRWLAGRPVAAAGDGLGYRARKLAARHPVAATLAACLLAGTVAGSTWFVRSSLVARERLEEIQRLGDARRLAALLEEEPRLWPADPERAPALEAWLADARELLSRRGLHEASLADLDRAIGAVGEQVGGAAREARDWDEWRRARVAEHVAGLEALADDDPHGATLSSVGARLERARTLRARSIEAHRAAWDAALGRIAADPRLASLAPAPIPGLVPLGPDADGGCEAFWAIDTGARPERGPDGRFRVAAEQGLVLLLLPGGTARIGGQPEDPAAPHFDPSQLAEADSPMHARPVHTVELAPFLLSKFEVTQAQWERWTGANPAEYAAGRVVGDVTLDATHPVERVSQLEARAVLARFALDLPTEVQWEYAARAGSGSVWPTGDDERSLAGHVNIADAYARAHAGAPGWVYADWLDDGHTAHAPVGSYQPNPFGLHDVLGNVWEWCRDVSHPYSVPARPGDGLRGADLPVDPDADVAARGGGYGNPPTYLRSSARFPTSPRLESRSTGLRPARQWPSASSSSGGGGPGTPASGPGDAGAAASGGSSAVRAASQSSSARRE